MKRHAIYQATAGWKIYLSRLLAANVLLAIFLYLCRGSVSNWLLQAWQWRFTHLVLLLFGAILIYCATLWLLGCVSNIFRQAIRKYKWLTKKSDITRTQGQLEASLHQGNPELPMVVICHPHPLHQGTMNNKVVYMLSRAFAELSCSTLRFNYRGVGKR